MVQTRFQMISEKFNKAQTEENRKLAQERKKLMAQSKQPDDDSSLNLPREKKQISVKEADEIIQIREELKNKFKQIRVDEATDEESKEKQFKPITQQLDKVEKTLQQTDRDLSKKYDLIPVKKNFEPSTPDVKQITFAPEDDEEEISE